MSSTATASARQLIVMAPRAAAPTQSTGGIRQLDTAVKGQSSDHLTIQSYCLSVTQQAPLDLSAFPNLVQYQTNINQGLVTAQGHANTYLNQVSQNIVQNISNIQNYYTLHQAVPSALPAGSSTAEWISTLQALQQAAQGFQSQAASTTQLLQTLRSGVSADAAAFKQFVTDLNQAVGGDNGVLTSITGELGKIQGEVDGAIAGIAISGLAILGGVFMTCVGAIADFLTAGTSTPLVAGGVGIICAGVGGEVASSLTLKALLDQQGKLLREQAVLKSEVKTAAGLSIAYTGLENKAASAAQAALNMQNAWSFLSDHLGDLASDLGKGIQNTSVVRMLFLTAANSSLKSAQQDVNVIQGQMTGVKNLVAPAGTSIGDFLVATAQQAAA